MLKCSETQGITSSSTAKCNIPTPPEVPPLPAAHHSWAHPDFAFLFTWFVASFWEGFCNDFGYSLGHHLYQKSEKQRFQCSMKRAYENGPGKNWGLGALQTSKTSSACRREHDSVVWLDARKSLIFDAFWTSILEPLGPSCAENIVF